jgi:DNA (cytosine-5)-methyltransferase 1
MFTVVSTFSGCGGSSLGYHQAGGKVLLAVEWDDNAVANYRLNFPDTPVYHGDIAQLSVEEVLERTGLKPGELDILDGSPPCQGFSTAGNREFGDQRNQLFWQFVRLLTGLKPKCFVMENVSGMVKGKMKLIFAECMKELKAAGYRVKARLLNAKYYGVPQSRERVIFMGVREDLGIEPSYPKPTTLRPITVAQALAGLDLSHSTTMDQAKELPRFKVAKWLKFTKPGEGASKYHPRGSLFNGRRLDPNKPAPTIPRVGGAGSACIIHYDGLRYLTAEELLRLAGYPDDFRLVGTLGDCYARIGNSVPPPLIRAVANHIRDHVLSGASDCDTGCMPKPRS